MPRYVYTTDSGSGFFDHDLSSVTERRRVRIPRPQLSLGLEPVTEARNGQTGVVVEIPRGCPGDEALAIGRRMQREGIPGYFYWPREMAIERVDHVRLRSHSRVRQAERLWRLWRGPDREEPADLPESLGETFLPRPLPPPKDGGPIIKGPGLYLRLDYWNRFHSGGSYGHTVYVMRELARRFGSLHAVVNQIYELPGTEIVVQVEVSGHDLHATEIGLIEANSRLYREVRDQVERVRPAFIYERLVPGSWLGARISAELQVPYIAEYNGSESSIRRSFSGYSSFFDGELTEIEGKAFAQATLVTVVSEHIQNDLLRRGVSPAKVLVNPNGADPDVYRPPTGPERSQVRKELGFPEDARVIGFSGTFGGWHGIDLLAESLPLILAAEPRARFLLIGDGNFKHLVDQTVDTHQLADRVIRTGSVAQARGARLLQACDVLVSPHNRHMVDSPFFGSPTKLFEYMAVGAGIVASDLEQIGEVLRPALTPEEAAHGRSTEEARAVLCRPGNLDDFVTAVGALAKNGDLALQLGRNARAALLEHFTWKRHVDRLFETLDQDTHARPRTASVATVTTPPARETLREHTLDWFLEIERSRYRDSPWIPELVRFADYATRAVLEIGTGQGTDLARFAAAGAEVSGLAESPQDLHDSGRNLSLRGLKGDLRLLEAASFPWRDQSFDLVYSSDPPFSVIPPDVLASEILRVLRPGGSVVIVVYAEDSWHYWANLVLSDGLKGRLLRHFSIAEIMSRTLEGSPDSIPSGRLCTKSELRRWFSSFRIEAIHHRHLIATRRMRQIPGLANIIEKLAGWRLLMKASKPKAA